MSPCEDINENDQLIGPIKLLESVYYVNLTNSLTDTDSFEITTNQNQFWTKISNISEFVTSVCV